MTPVVLASRSAARAKLLSDAGVSFNVAPPRVDEEAAKAALLGEGLDPRAVADALAELKAIKTSSRCAGLVIGADQTLDLDGALISKGDSSEQVRGTLVRLRGRAHRLHAAVVVARDGQSIWREVKTATLQMREFSDSFLDAYLEREGEAALWTVGGYRLEAQGLQLFDRVEGDYFTILGLPMLGLLSLLRRHGALAT